MRQAGRHPPPAQGDRSPPQGHRKAAPRPDPGGEASPPPCPLVRRRGPACAPRVAVTGAVVVAVAVVAGPPSPANRRLPGAPPRRPAPRPHGPRPPLPCQAGRPAPASAAPAALLPPGHAPGRYHRPPPPAEWYGGGKACLAGLCCPKTTWPPRLRHISRLPFAAILSEGGGGAGVGGHLGPAQLGFPRSLRRGAAADPLLTKPSKFLRIAGRGQFFPVTWSASCYAVSYFLSRNCSISPLQAEARGQEYHRVPGLACAYSHRPAHRFI